MSSCLAWLDTGKLKCAVSSSSRALPGREFYSRVELHFPVTTSLPRSGQTEGRWKYLYYCFPQTAAACLVSIGSPTVPFNHFFLAFHLFYIWKGSWCGIKWRARAYRVVWDRIVTCLSWSRILAGAGLRPRHDWLLIWQAGFHRKKWGGNWRGKCLLRLSLK